MDDASGERTTFVCPFGKFKYCRMPFGLKNVPAIFQEAVSKVLEPVKSKACNYIDDVVVFGVLYRAWVKQDFSPVILWFDLKQIATQMFSIVSYIEKCAL